jgi:peptide/nickel transport system ATP-binding protein
MLDVSIRVQILELMKKLKQEENVSFLYITHDLATSQYVGDNIIILYKGQIIEQGNIKQVLYNPLHPYTRALISAIPKFTNNQHQEIKIKDDHEAAASHLGGCKFINKCLYSTEKCKNNEPLLSKEEIRNPQDPSNSHFIRCFNYESIS